MVQETIFWMWFNNIMVSQHRRHCHEACIFRSFKTFAV